MIRRMMQGDPNGQLLLPIRRNVPARGHCQEFHLQLPIMHGTHE
jgi:hypothetical protein